MNSKAVHQIQQQILNSAFLRTQQKFPPSSLRFSRLISKRQNHREDGANFCGLCRKAEL